MSVYQGIRRSDKIPLMLKQQFRAEVAEYFRAKDGLSPVARHIREEQILRNICKSCAENNVEARATMTRVYNAALGVDLEKLMNFNLKDIAMLKNIGVKSGGILYELITYCKDLDQDTETQSGIEGVEARLKAAQKLLRESDNILTELLRQVKETAESKPDKQT